MEICENNLDNKERPDPEFEQQLYYHYFKAKNKTRNLNKLFCIPPWMKTLDPLKKEMNTDLPMYQEITKVINYMHSSSTANNSRSTVTDRQ